MLTGWQPPPKAELRQATAPAEGILRAATPAACNLLVLVARLYRLWEELFHESVTAQLLRHSPVPVPVLPAGRRVSGAE